MTFSRVIPVLKKILTETFFFCVLAYKVERTAWVLSIDIWKHFWVQVTRVACVEAAREKLQLASVDAFEK